MKLEDDLRDRLDWAAAHIEVPEAPIDVLRRRGTRRRLRERLVAGTAVLTVLGLFAWAAAGLLALGGDAEAHVPAASSGPPVSRTYPLGGHLTSVAVGLGYVWVTHDPPGAIQQIDPKTGKVVDTIGGHYTSVATGRNAIWAIDQRGNVSRVEPFSTTWTITLSGTGNTDTKLQSLAGTSPSLHYTVVPHGKTAWIATPSSRIMKGLFGPTVTRIIVLGQRGVDVAVGLGRAWVAGGIDPVVRRFDASSVTEQGEIQIDRSGTASVNDVEVGAGSVWACCDAQGRIARIDPDTNRVVDRLELPTDDTSSLEMAFAGDQMWALFPCHCDERQPGRVFRIDPETGRIEGPVGTPGEPSGIATGAGYVWVIDRELGSLSRINPDARLPRVTFGGSNWSWAIPVAVLLAFGIAAAGAVARRRQRS